MALDVMLHGAAVGASTRATRAPANFTGSKRGVDDLHAKSAAQTCERQVGEVSVQRSRLLFMMHRRTARSVKMSSDCILSHRACPGPGRSRVHCLCGVRAALTASGLCGGWRRSLVVRVQAVWAAADGLADRAPQLNSHPAVTANTEKTGLHRSTRQAHDRRKVGQGGARVNTAAAGVPER